MDRNRCQFRPDRNRDRVRNRCQPSCRPPGGTRTDENRGDATIRRARSPYFLSSSDSRPLHRPGLDPARRSDRPRTLPPSSAPPGRGTARPGSLLYIGHGLMREPTPGNLRSRPAGRPPGSLAARPVRSPDDREGPACLAHRPLGTWPDQAITPGVPRRVSTRPGRLFSHRIASHRDLIPFHPRKGMTASTTSGPPSLPADSVGHSCNVGNPVPEKLRVISRILL